MKYDVIDLDNKKIASVDLSDAIFGVEVREDIIARVIDWQLAGRRAGTHKTKGISDVSGTTKKPFKQKGTGNARQGSIRAPQWIKGGVVFAPKPRDFSKKVNKQMKQLAFVSALSEAAREKNIIVLDELVMSKPNTKEFANILANIKADKRVLVVTEENNTNVYLSARNIDKVAVTPAALACTYDIVVADKIVVTKAALKSIEEANK